MERYPLSADFAEKQLQVLQRKYGGPDASSRAALTIQRAFRRYVPAPKKGREAGKVPKGMGREGGAVKLKKIRFPSGCT